MVKNIFCVLCLFVLTSCGGGKLSELNNNLEKLEEFNEKYVDVDKFERDKDDENKDSDLLDEFRFACEWDQEDEYALFNDIGDIEFPKNLVTDTKKLSKDCIQAWNTYVAYLEWDYTEKNISTPGQTACLQGKINQTNTNLKQFQIKESELSSRYTALSIKYIPFDQIGSILSTNPDDYKALSSLHLDYGMFKISLITDSTLHLLTKDVCVKTGIEKDVLESLDNQFSGIND